MDADEANGSILKGSDKGESVDSAAEESEPDTQAGPSPSRLMPPLPGGSDMPATTAPEQRTPFDLPIYLNRSERAILRVPAPMTSAEFENLKKRLEASLEGLRNALVADADAVGSPDAVG